MQGYKSIPLVEVPSADRLLPACIQEPLTLVAKTIFIGGACVWLTGPLVAVASVFFASCWDGAPLAFYVASFIKVVCTIACEQVCVRRIQRSFDLWPHGKSGEIYSQAFSEVVKKTGSLLTGKMDFWPILIISGVASLLDFETDNAQFGQIRACDINDPRFNAQYAHSFHLAFVRQALQFARFEGLFAAMLVLTYVVQGLRGLVKSYKLWAKLMCEVSTTEVGDLLGNVAEEAMWSNMHYLSALMRLSLNEASEIAALAVQVESNSAEAAAKAAEEAVENGKLAAGAAQEALEKAKAAAIEAQHALEEANKAADALESAEEERHDLMSKVQNEEMQQEFYDLIERDYYSADNNVKTAKEGVEEANARQKAAEKDAEEANVCQRAAEKDAEEANVCQRAAEAASYRAHVQQEAAEKAARGVAFNEVVTVVLCENAPSLFLVSGFFSLRLHGEGALQLSGIIKVLLSMLLSSASAMSKASKVAKFGCAGFFTAVLIAIVVLYSILKAGLAFYCSSGFFSFVTMQCDRVIQ